MVQVKTVNREQEVDGIIQVRGYESGYIFEVNELIWLPKSYMVKIKEVFSQILTHAQ